MKRFLALSIVLAALLVSPAAHAATTPFAQHGKFGLGLGGSSLISGISGKLYLQDNVALQATLGWWQRWGAAANLDGIVEMPQLWSNGTLSMNWNVGAGVGLGINRGVGLGVAGVGGLGFQIKPIHVEVVAELRPTFVLGRYDWSGFWLGGGGAIRYFF